MPSYEHKQLIERISQLDEVPENFPEYASWIKADGHLALLQDNVQENELAIYASGNYTLVYSVVVSEDSLAFMNQDDLLDLTGNFSSCAGYVERGGKDDIQIESGIPPWPQNTFENARQLAFRRTFEGWNGEGRIYFEILQEYAHLTEIHWRPERGAYCRYDEHGELEHVVSVTFEENEGDVTLVSFEREPLEQFLAASNSVLIRKFDFTLLRQESFNGWPDGPESTFTKSDNFFYRQKIIDGYAGYTYGVQIIRPSHPNAEIFSSLKGNWSGDKGGEYVEFVAHDWRNNRITNISTDPSATTNYFQAHKNSLPFEISPAFFRPDVLLKYKGDRDRYTIKTRSIHCRNAWALRFYDVNKAGQVHAYIRYLRQLPYQEQLYWKSFNEEPKSGISKRAVEHDFEGKFTEIADSSEKILWIVRRWAESDLTWWKLREEALLERISTPRTSSRDEWATAFMNLAKLIIEGFVVKAIRKRLEEMDIAFDKQDGSLALLEKLLIGHSKLDGEQRLDGLRTVQLIRTKNSAHSGGSVAVDLANNVLREHGTYSAHFENICRVVTDELKLIEQAFS